MAEQTGNGADRSERNSLDLDALAVSDRFRLFNFTRRDDHVAYLWVLRALDRLRGVHQVQAHPDDVAAALAELAAAYDEVPRITVRVSRLVADGLRCVGRGAAAVVTVSDGTRLRRSVSV